MIPLQTIEIQERARALTFMAHRAGGAYTVAFFAVPRKSAEHQKPTGFPRLRFDGALRFSQVRGRHGISKRRHPPAGTDARRGRLFSP